VIPVARVCEDYFSHLDERQFIRKATAGQIDLPVIAIEASNKSARGVHVEDLARWIDKRRDAARRENDQVQGRR